MDMRNGDSKTKIVIAFSAGLLAGLLSIAMPFLLRDRQAALFFGLFVGDVFGVVFFVYFWVCQSVRSLQKAIGFILTSTFSYVLAFYVTSFSAMFLGLHGSTQANATGVGSELIGAFFIGGTVGAFPVLFVALLFFSSEGRLSRVVTKSLVWSIAGGVLATLGWALGPSLGGILVSALGQKAVLSSPGDAGTDHYYSLLLVWQSGMGLVLGILTEEEVREGQTSTSGSGSTVKPLLPIKVAGISLVTIAAIGIGFVALNEVPRESDMIRWRQMSIKYGVAPPLENLPR